MPDYPCGMEENVSKPPHPDMWVLTYIELLFDTPVCLLIFVAYLRGWHWRKPLELIVGAVQVSGTVMFIGPELYNGLRTCPASAPMGGPEGMFQNMVRAQ